MEWNTHDALDGLTQDEIAALSLDDIKKREKLATEQNAWTLARNVAERINHEPGPAGDYMQSFLTPHKNAQFFFNTEQLRQFVSAPDSKKKDIPGSAYFKKINTFKEDHVQVGKLYLEYIKSDCQNKNNTLCGFCAKFPSSAPGLARVPNLKMGHLHWMTQSLLECFQKHLLWRKV